MKNDPLQQFIALRASLLKEKTTLLARLAQIENALGSVEALQVPAATAAVKPARIKATRKAKAAKKAKPAKRKAPARRREGPGLRQIIRDMLVEKPLTKAEIIEGLKKTGRDFPSNYIAVTLYKKGNFKRTNDRFSLIN